VGFMVGRGETVQELVWRPEVNRSLGKRRHKCKDKHKIDHQFVVW